MFLSVCLSQGFYFCTNIMTKKQVGEERVYSAYTSILLFITKGCQDWNSGRPGSRSWCRSHGGMLLTGLLPLACSACFLIEPKTTRPEMVPPTRGPPPLITNWEKCLTAGSHGGISSTEAPFSVITPAVSSWHKKPASTTSMLSFFGFFLLALPQQKSMKSQFHKV